ncbi:hypothetical protein AB0C33_26550 [Nonomuraea sp. NPDC048881]
MTGPAGLSTTTLTVTLVPPGPVTVSGTRTRAARSAGRRHSAVTRSISW